jgi:hypothetical protein
MGDHDSYSDMSQVQRFNSFRTLNIELELKNLETRSGTFAPRSLLPVKNPG